VALFDGGVGAASVLVIVLALIVTGWLNTKGAMDAKDKQIADLTQALHDERTRSDINVQTAHVVREVMTGLRKEISQ
jgi:hypothetical protein